MEESAPDWFWVLVISVMPATMLLLWILSSLPLSDGALTWLAKNGFAYIFIASGVVTGLLLWYGSNKYQ